MEILYYICLGCLALPICMTLANLPFFRRATRPKETMEAVTVCIPARNEAAHIEATLQALLADPNLPLTVLVGDDHSEDDTAARVRRFAQSAPRVRLVSIPELPEGWSGKMHACHHLASQATTSWIAFLDADVRLTADALPRLQAEAQAASCDLLSGFPRQQTQSLGEALLIPHIQFILLGFLPFFLARFVHSAALAAGCGQLFLVKKAAYEAIGGHRSISLSVHDGLHLPRAFRQAGFRTRAVDASDVARCRMYEDLRSTWLGLSKNATDGMGAPGSIGPFTVLLGAGQVLPALLTLLGQAAFAPLWLLSTVHHLALALKFGQSWRTALLHPVGIFILLIIQWNALGRKLRGAPTVAWKGRSYPASSNSGKTSA